jgi:hypothetical protein
MTPKANYILLVFLSALSLCVCRARAECIEFTTDGAIEDGDVYGCVRILNDATVDMTGGSVTGYIALTDTATLNLSAGWVDSIDANAQSTLNITGGEVPGTVDLLDYSTLNLRGGSLRRIKSDAQTTLNISGGSVDDIWAHGSSTIKITGGNLDGLRLDFDDQTSVNIYDVNMLNARVVGYGDATLNIYAGNISVWSHKILCEVNILGGNVTIDRPAVACTPRGKPFSVYGYDSTYDPNSRVFTASLLYGGQVTLPGLDPYSYECLNFVFSPPPVVEIVRTLRQKSETLHLIDRMLEAEYAAYDALDELLRTGDYGDFTKSDVVQARQRVHTAIRHELQSKRALQKSIDKLNDALDLLNWYSPPYDLPPPGSSPEEQSQSPDKPAASAVVAKPPRK